MPKDVETSPLHGVLATWDICSEKRDVEKREIKQRMGVHAKRGSECLLGEALSQSERPAAHVCESLDSAPACEKAWRRMLTNTARDAQVEGQGTSCLRSLAIDYTIHL